MKAIFSIVFAAIFCLVGCVGDGGVIVKQDNTILIDVRTPEEFASGHIE